MFTKSLLSRLLFASTLIFLSVSLSFSPIAVSGAIQPDYSWSMDSLFGSHVGNPTVNSNDCVKGNCLNFDGSSCITAGNGLTSATNVQNTVTYTLWIKTGSEVTSLQYVLNQNVDHIITEEIRNARGVFVDKGLIGIYTRQGDNTWEQINLVTAIPNSWYFISLVQNSNVLTGYVNGAEVQKPLTFTGLLTSYANSWLVGCVSYNLINLGFKGTIDDVHIYSTALNSTTIQSLYTSYSYTPSYTQPYSRASNSQQTQQTQGGNPALNFNYQLDLILAGLIILIPIISILSKRNIKRNTVNRNNIQKTAQSNSVIFNGPQICVNCRSRLNTGDNFCPECGSPILNLREKQNF